MTEGLETPLTELLGIAAPIVQAPIGDLAPPRLVAAVSNAGGLGMHPLSWTEPEALEGIIAETRELTAKPFGVNLMLDFEQDERLGICLDAGVELISFFWGDPGPFIGRVHAAGARRCTPWRAPTKRNASSTPAPTSSSPKAGKPAATSGARSAAWR